MQKERSGGKVKERGVERVRKGAKEEWREGRREGRKEGRKEGGRTIALMKTVFHQLLHRCILILTVP